MNFQVIASFLIAFPLKSSLHAHIMFPFTLLPSYTSFSPLTSPNSPLSSNNSFWSSFFLSDTRTVLPTTTTHPHPAKLYFPSSSFTNSLSLFPSGSTPSYSTTYYCLCPRGRRHRLLSLQAVPSFVLPLSRVPFAPSLIYCITVHEVANLRRVILYKYVSQINNRPGDMSLCAVPAPRLGTGDAVVTTLGIYTMKWPDSWSR